MAKSSHAVNAALDEYIWTSVSLAAGTITYVRYAESVAAVKKAELDELQADLDRLVGTLHP